MIFISGHVKKPIPALKLLYPVLIPVSKILPRLKKGPPDWRDPAAADTRVQYDCYPLRAVREFGLLLEAMRLELARIQVPVLLMHSRQDGFIPYPDMERLARALKRAEVRTFTVEESNHIISCDISRQQVFEQALRFVNAL